MSSTSAGSSAEKGLNKDCVWWIPNIDKRITPEVRSTLETYSKIPSGEVANHIYDIREKAWKIHPYPCTGHGFFFRPTLPVHPSYNDLINVLRAGGRLLDIGCCTGTDLRRLFLDGIPATQLYATDLDNYWNLGFELFRDQEQKFGLESTYIQDDLLNPSSILQKLSGTIDAITGVHLLHNWTWDTQVLACTQIVSLLRPVENSIFLGTQIGTFSNDSSTWASEEAPEEVRFQSVESFTHLWEKVGEKTGTEWKVNVTIESWASLGEREEEFMYLGEEKGFLHFNVTRVKSA